MIRTLVCAVGLLLLAGVLLADDEKPEAKGDVPKEKSSEPVQKNGKEKVKKGDPEVKGDAVKVKSPDSVKQDGKEGFKKTEPGAKGDVVKGKGSEPGKKEAKEGFKKGQPEAKKVPTEKGLLKEGKAAGGGQKGLLNKIGVEGGIVKLSVNGQEYEFPVTDKTAAVVTTQEQDGKQVVMGIYLVNATEGFKKGGETKEGKNPKEQPIEMKWV